MLLVMERRGHRTCAVCEQGGSATQRVREKEETVSERAGGGGLFGDYGNYVRRKEGRRREREREREREKKKGREKGLGPD